MQLLAVGNEQRIGVIISERLRFALEIPASRYCVVATVAALTPKRKKPLRDAINAPP